MTLTEKLFRAIAFIKKKSPQGTGIPDMTMADLLVFLVVAQAKKIAVGEIAQQLDMKVPSVMQKLTQLKTHEYGGQLVGPGLVAIERTKNMEDHQVTITDKGKEFIHEMIFYVEKR